jgi:pimeloyl-ACP methyl ester carboxylesterase
MLCWVNDVAVHYAEQGHGLPLIALHGAGVDYREIEAAIEPLFEGRDGYRRIYIDLPGMGQTPAPESLTSNDDVVAVLLGVADKLTSGGSFLLLGHSYGAYLARALASNCRDRAMGLALLCPVGERTRDVPPHAVVRVEGDPHEVLAPHQVQGFEEYFVVRTPATARRYRDHVFPGTTLANEDGLGRIFAHWALRPRPEQRGAYPHPTLILAGRQDSAVGYAAAADLLEHYPHATYAALDGAGHALPHEQPELLADFIDDWLARIQRAGTALPSR